MRSPMSIQTKRLTRRTVRAGYAVALIAIAVLAGHRTGLADGPATTGPVTAGPATVRPGTAGPGLASGVGHGHFMANAPLTTRPAANKVSIYGIGMADPHRVIYMVDTSGSMIGVFGDVKATLKQSVQAIKSTDDHPVEFNIITFSDENEPRILFKDGPQPATVDNKRTAVEFIDDSVASGGTQPMPAIKAALATDPPADEIFLMTDGFDNVASFDDVTDAFKEGTKDGKTAVNCIHFVAEPDPKLAQALQKIARDCHGEYKQIQKSDLQ